MGTRDKRRDDLERRERELVEMLAQCAPRDRLFLESDLEDVRAKLAAAGQRKGRAA